MLLITNDSQLRASNSQPRKYNEVSVKVILEKYQDYSTESFQNIIESANRSSFVSEKTKLNNEEALRRKVTEQNLQSAANVLGALSLNSSK